MIEHREGKRARPGRLENDRLQPDWIAIFEQVRLQQFGYTAGPGDDRIGPGQRRQVRSAHRRTSNPVAFEQGFQLPLVIHLICCGERRRLHGKSASRRDRIQPPPVRSGPRAWIVSLRINDSDCAILANTFDQQDMLCLGQLFM